MPEYSGIIKKIIKNPLPTVAATTAVTVGWWVGVSHDPNPIGAALALMGLGGVGVLVFTLRPYRPRPHSSSSLPLFPALVVA